MHLLAVNHEKPCPGGIPILHGLPSMASVASIEQLLHSAEEDKNSVSESDDMATPLENEGSSLSNSSVSEVSTMESQDNVCLCKSKVHTKKNPERIVTELFDVKVLPLESRESTESSVCDSEVPIAESQESNVSSSRHGMALPLDSQESILSSLSTSVLIGDPFKDKKFESMFHLYSSYTIPLTSVKATLLCKERL